MSDKRPHRPQAMDNRMPYLSGTREQASELAAELKEQSWLADLGELAGPLAHSFNNYLNVVHLHAATMMDGASESLRAELAEIRQQGKAVEALIRRFQRYRSDCTTTPRLLDLKDVVRRAVADWEERFQNQQSAPSGSRQVTLDLSSDDLPVRAAGTDLQRLVRLLLNNAATASGEDGIVQVTAARRTQAAAHSLRSSGQNSAERTVVELRVEDSGPSLTEEALSHLFEPMGTAQEAQRSLELAACRSVVRRWRGSIRGENRPEGGVAIIVELPFAAS